MKKAILYVVIMLTTVVAIGQNKIDGNGQRKGKWTIYYKYKDDGSFHFKDEEGLIYHDLTGTILAPELMLVTTKETDSKTDFNYMETVKYERGIKEGDFIVYKKTKSGGDYVSIVTGSYLNGKITGVVSMLVNEKTTMLYENGIIKDQAITLKGSSVDVDYKKAYPKIVIRNGRCVDRVVTNGDYQGYKFALGRWVPNENRGFTMYLYTEKYKGVFDSDLLLEVSEIDTNFTQNGLVKLYNKTNTNELYDTSAIRLFYSALYKDGKKNGQEWTKLSEWDGEKYQKTIMKCNYLNDKLNGPSSIETEEGKFLVEANYKNGLLNGKYITYGGRGNSLYINGPYCVTDTNTRLNKIKVNSEDTRKMYNVVSKYLKQKIVDMSNINKFFEATFVNGRINDKYYYYQSNNLKLKEGFVTGCKETDWRIFDINGNILTTQTQNEELLTKQLEDAFKGPSPSSVVKCPACSKQIKVGDAIQASKGCDCFQDDNSPINVASVDILGRNFFCSYSCKASYDRECCRRNGYNYEKRK